MGGLAKASRLIILRDETTGMLESFIGYSNAAVFFFFWAVANLQRFNCPAARHLLRVRFPGAGFVSAHSIFSACSGAQAGDRSGKTRKDWLVNKIVWPRPAGNGVVALDVLALAELLRLALCRYLRERPHTPGGFGARLFLR